MNPTPSTPRKPRVATPQKRREIVYRLALATGYEARTIDRVLDGHPVHASTRTNVFREAKRMNVKIPDGRRAGAHQNTARARRAV